MPTTAHLLLRAATHDDVQAIADLSNLYETHVDGADVHTTTDSLRNQYNTPRFSLADDVRLAFAPDGALVGIAELWATNVPPVHPYLWACVHPDHWGRGIGTALLDWAVERARTVALPRCPADARISLVTGMNHRNDGARALLSDYGMTYNRSFYHMRIDMTGAPPAPAAPPGITLRVYRGEDEAADVYRAYDESFEDHYGHVDQPFEVGYPLFRHRMIDDPDHDPALWFVAQDDATGALAGVTLCTPNWQNDPKRGWVNVVGVRRAYRGRGIAQALLYMAFGAFRARGAPSVGLGVDASSLTGAVRLYERVGMYPEKQYDTYELELRAGRELRTESAR